METLKSMYLRKQTGLSKEHILHDVTSGQVPTITIDRKGDGDIYARNSDEIYSDFKANVLLKNFEAGDKMEQAAVNLIFAGIMIQDYTHVGHMKTNDGDITGAHWDGHFY